MGEEHLVPARPATALAMPRRDNAAANERLMIEALALRYGEGKAGDDEVG